MRLRAAAEGSDGVIHLAFIHDFSNYGHSLEVDQRAIEAFGAALSGSDRPLLIAGGLLGLGGEHVATEREMHDPAMPRAASAAATLALADKGVRSMVVRFAPTVHGEGDEGFIAMLTTSRGSEACRATWATARATGLRCIAATPRTSCALAFEHAPAGSILHAGAEEGVQSRAIAEAIGRSLELPVVSVEAERAVEHFGWIGPIFALDARASNVLTRELLGWDPTGPGLIEDIDAGPLLPRVRRPPQR